MPCTATSSPIWRSQASPRPRVEEQKMAFEATRFTIIANAAGSGTWRMWNYIPSPETADDALTDAGYFGAMVGHIHAVVLLVVATARAVRLMAFGIGDDGIVAVPMSEAVMPESNMN